MWRPWLKLYNRYTPAFQMKYRCNLSESAMLDNEINPFHPSPAQLQATRRKDLHRAALILNASRGYTTTGWSDVTRHMQIDKDPYRAVTLTHRVTEGKFLVRRVQVMSMAGNTLQRTEWVEDSDCIDWTHLVSKALQQPMVQEVLP